MFEPNNAAIVGTRAVADDDFADVFDAAALLDNLDNSSDDGEGSEKDEANRGTVGFLV